MMTARFHRIAVGLAPIAIGLMTVLVQGTDSTLKGALKYLWALARKPWPWGS